MDSSIAKVSLLGKEIGVAKWVTNKGYCSFSYNDEFIDFAIDRGIVLSPFATPLKKGSSYFFPELNRSTFYGLPGLLADSLPDQFGTSIIDQYIRFLGRTSEEVNPLQKLLVLGDRAMGALTYQPYNGPKLESKKLDFSKLVRFAQQGFPPENLHNNSHDELNLFVATTTSAGGAKPKAILEFCPSTGQFQIEPNDSIPSIVKFDCSQSDKQHEYLPATRMEYAYYLQAKAAGINMMNSWLIEDDEGHHFVTERFDRKNGYKMFMQTFCGAFHTDFREKGYSYEQAAVDSQKYFKLEDEQIESLFRIAVFNVVYRNEDDHSKNLSLLADHTGKFTLAPAYDLTYSHIPPGEYTESGHCMSVASKNQFITIQDLIDCGIVMGIQQCRVDQIIDEVLSSRDSWMSSAEAASIPEYIAVFVQKEIYRKDLEA